MNQIALPLAWPADPRDEEFVVSAANARASHLIEHWGTWPVMTALLTGPRKSGRSLLARIFASKSGGRVIDGADRQDEEALFHAWNAAQAERRPLVLIADLPPPAWQIALPDLRSRLAASPIATIDPPDDALMAALLEREFLRRGLDARAELIAFLLSRIERSYVAVLGAVEALDQAVLESRRRLTVGLARTVLDAARSPDAIELKIEQGPE